MVYFKYFLIILIIFAIFLTSSLFLVSESQIDQAIDLTQNNLYKATILLAFIGGVLTVFAPCLGPFLVAYFAYSFKEKKELTKNTFVFFLGFISVFIPFGFSLSFLGQQIRIYYSELILASGIFIVVFGLMTIFGKGFSLVKNIPKIKEKNILSVYLLGILFTLGWSPCVGPILFSILFLAANLPNLIYTFALLLSYALGVWIPFFFLSYFYDKYRIYNSKWISGRPITIFGGIKTNLTSLMSGILLVFLGGIYIIFRGTQFFNISSLWTQNYVLQSLLLSSNLLNSIGNLLGIIIIVALVYFMYKRILNLKKNS